MWRSTDDDWQTSAIRDTSEKADEKRKAEGSHKHENKIYDIYIYCICIYLICSTCPTWHVLEFLFCHCNSSWLACSSQHFKSSMFCFRHVLCTPTLQRFCPLETIFGLENKGEAEAHKTCRAAGKRPIATYGYGSGASG